MFLRKFLYKIKNRVYCICNDYNNSLNELITLANNHQKFTLVTGLAVVGIITLSYYKPDKNDFESDLILIQNKIACLSDYSRNIHISNEIRRRRFLLEKNRLIFSNYFILTFVTESKSSIHSFEFKENELHMKWYKKYLIPAYFCNKLVDIGFASYWLWNDIYFSYADSPNLISLDDCSLFGCNQMDEYEI